MNWEKITDKVVLVALVVVACWMAARTPVVVQPTDKQLIEGINQALQQVDGRLKALEGHPPAENPKEPKK